MFGSLLASCGYDRKVIIWKETSGTWAKLYEYANHDSSGMWKIDTRTHERLCLFLQSFCVSVVFVFFTSPNNKTFRRRSGHFFSPTLTRSYLVVNSVCWAPHEFGLVLACGSSDGSISIISSAGDGSWDSKKIPNAHTVRKIYSLLELKRIFTKKISQLRTKRIRLLYCVCWAVSSASWKLAPVPCSHGDLKLFPRLQTTLQGVWGNHFNFQLNSNLSGIATYSALYCRLGVTPWVGVQLWHQARC